MKKLTALVRESKDSQIEVIVSDYPCKRNFYQDLKINGYRVLEVLSEENISDIKTKKTSEIPIFTSNLVIDYVKNFL